tara:strand:+ start:161 stop:799 length:639 start_codon:yes stop_codon:yes gene_type:complete
LGISAFDWIELIYKHDLKDNLAKLFDSFLNDTKNELYEDRDKLYDLTQNKDVIDSYINGDLGYNLLFVYKASVLSNHIDDLMNLAKDTVLQLLIDNKIDSPENKQFVDDALSYDLCINSNIFTNLDDTPSTEISFDLKQFNTDKTNHPLKHYKLTNKKNVKFILEKTQKDVIKRSVTLYGISNLGVGRILTKVFVKNLLRHPIYQDETSILN